MKRARNIKSGKKTKDQLEKNFTPPKKDELREATSPLVKANH
jgi:hypothetical protein